MDLGRIIELRIDNDLTQTDLGNIVDNRKSTVSNWENGNEIIPIVKLWIIAKYFGVSIDFLLKLSDARTIKHSYTEIDKKVIGNRIKLVRLENKISQRKLASMLNTSHSTLSAYESGKTLILTAFAYQICLNFRISMDWILGLSDVKNLDK